MQQVQAFYDELSNAYTNLIRKCVPRYDEMVFNLFNYIPATLKPANILDLGCGTGNLTAAALQHYPGATIHALDISAEILNECRARFAGKSNLIYYQQDFSALQFGDQTFDLIISAIAIHHITDEQKIKLYAKLYKMLKPGGVFIFADQTSGATDETYQKHIVQWQQKAYKLGSTQQNWDMWMEHQTAHDYHAPTLWHLEQLRLAGYTDIDVIWKNLLWCVMTGSKT